MRDAEEQIRQKKIDDKIRELEEGKHDTIKNGKFFYQPDTIPAVPRRKLRAKPHRPIPGVSYLCYTGAYDEIQS